MTVFTFFTGTSCPHGAGSNFSAAVTDMNVNPAREGIFSNLPSKCMTPVLSRNNLALYPLIFVNLLFNLPLSSRLSDDQRAFGSLLSIPALFLVRTSPSIFLSYI